jgi:hypothetical protein
MAKATEIKPKNPRYRGSKISEDKLRHIVRSFAADKTAKEAATTAKVSKPTAENIYRRLRERLVEHPIARFDLDPTPPPDTRAVINRQAQGVSPAQMPSHVIALLTGILNAQHFQGFERLSAGNPDHVKRAVALMKMKANSKRRYNIYEELALRPGETATQTRPFDPLDYEPTSGILVNEIKADPHDAHFRYIWKLLLKHPL